MNCKPGDLAIVLRGLKVDCPHVGKIVEVISAHGHNKKFGHMWNVRFSVPIVTQEVTIKGAHLGPGGYRAECQAADSWLKPLPKIEDDAVDEILQLVGAPSKEGVTA